jgi:3-oxoacyl-[acyl-carrier-protein] synthase II
VTAAVSVLGIGQALPPVDLPGRGYRRLPAAAKYALAAAASAAAAARPAFTRIPEPRRGVVLGTNNATAALHDTLDGAVTDGDAMGMSPSTAPFFASSLFAARVAMEHAARGFALTVNSPRTAGLQAFAVSARALRHGRADVVLAGAAEDDVAVAGAPSPGVGSVMFVCGKASEPGIGRVAVRSAFVVAGPAATDHLDVVWADVVGSAGPAVTAFLDGSPVADVVAEWLSRKGVEFSRDEPPPGCLSPVSAVAAALTGGGARPRAVVSAGADGGVTIALVCRSRSSEEQRRATSC